MLCLLYISASFQRIPLCLCYICLSLLCFYYSYIFKAYHLFLLQLVLSKDGTIPAQSSSWIHLPRQLVSELPASSTVSRVSLAAFRNDKLFKVRCLLLCCQISAGVKLTLLPRYINVIHVVIILPAFLNMLNKSLSMNNFDNIRF